MPIEIFDFMILSKFWSRWWFHVSFSTTNGNGNKMWQYDDLTQRTKKHFNIYSTPYM